MSDKYIIKNCNVIFKHGDFYFCQSSENLAKNVYCQDCTDCILKQIVELCKDAQSECSCKNTNKDVDCFECTSGGRAELGTEILQLLDIQECE